MATNSMLQLLWVVCRGAAILAFFLLATTASNALVRDRDITQYKIDVWTTESGLPQNAARAVLQTQDGFLWVATEGGRARFDGIRFDVFTTVTTPALDHNIVGRLFQDQGGTLWISTLGGGVTRYRNGVFTADKRFPKRSAIGFTSIWVDAAKNVWAGGMGLSLICAHTDNMDLPTVVAGFPAGNIHDRFLSEVRDGQENRYEGSVGHFR